MRHIDKTQIAQPAVLTSEECLGHLNQILHNPGIAVKDDYYKGKIVNPSGTIEYSVRDSLKTLYKNKCAYCEKTTNKPEIDHHRPVNRVVGTPRTNQGYYWLCYEWTNLVPSCHDCNSFEAKGSKYTLKGDGARNNVHPSNNNIIDFESFKYDSDFNLNERALLLHPEYCNPEDHFSFDTNGRIIGTSDEGIATIEILKIDNADLNGWRRSIYNNHLAILREKVAYYYNRFITPEQFSLFIEDFLKRLIFESIDDNLEYTLFRKYLVKNIDSLFISEFDQVFQGELRRVIVEAFIQVIEEYRHFLQPK